MVHRDYFVFSIRNWRRLHRMDCSRRRRDAPRRRRLSVVIRSDAALQDFRSRVADIIDLRNAKQIESRAGFIPVGGVLRNIANSNGMLIGDAAGAVSPLTAGGLDPCMRLSAFAASVVTEYLSTGDVQVLQAYSGELFRSRFASRLWARRIASTIRQPTTDRIRLCTITSCLCSASLQITSSSAAVLFRM